MFQNFDSCCGITEMLIQKNFNTKKLRRFLTKHKHYKILRSLAKKFGKNFTNSEIEM